MQGRITRKDLTDRLCVVKLVDINLMKLNLGQKCLDGRGKEY